MKLRINESTVENGVNNIMVRLIKEAKNPENAEINKKIANTIRTKVNKEPKYKADLEVKGLRLLKNGHSSYGNWTVEGPNGNTVCLSKGLDKKPRLYNGFDPIVTKDVIDDFDFYNYLTLDVSGRRDYRAHGGIGKTNDKYSLKMKDGSAIDADFSDPSKTQRFKNLKHGIKSDEQSANYYIREIKRAKEQIDNLEKSILRNQDNLDKYDTSISDKLKQINDLITDMRSKYGKNESLHGKGLREASSDSPFLGYPDNNKTNLLKLMAKYHLSSDAILNELLQFLPDTALNGFIDSIISDWELDD